MQKKNVNPTSHKLGVLSAHCSPIPPVHEPLKNKGGMYRNNATYLGKPGSELAILSVYPAALVQLSHIQGDS